MGWEAMSDLKGELGCCVAIEREDSLKYSYRLEVGGRKGEPCKITSKRLFESSDPPVK